MGNSQFSLVAYTLLLLVKKIPYVTSHCSPALVPALDEHVKMRQAVLGNSS